MHKITYIICRYQDPIIYICREHIIYNMHKITYNIHIYNMHTPGPIIRTADYRDPCHSRSELGSAWETMGTCRGHTCIALHTCIISLHTHMYVEKMTNMHVCFIHMKEYVFHMSCGDLGRFTPRTFHPRMVHPRTFHPRMIHPPDSSPPG